MTQTRIVRLQAIVGLLVLLCLFTLACQPEPAQANRNYLVVFKRETTEGRIAEIVTALAAEILKSPPPGFTPEYMIRLPRSEGYELDVQKIRSFPEVSLVSIASVGYAHTEWRAGSTFAPAGSVPAAPAE